LGGEELQSEGFSQCSAVIVQSQDDQQAYLAHVDKWQLSDKQYAELDQLGAGNYKVTPVVASLSRVGAATLTNPKVSEFMQKLESKGRKAQFADEVKVQSGDSHWWVSYNPPERKLKVLVRGDKTVQEFHL
jgi:hypothetical protein